MATSSLTSNGEDLQQLKSIQKEFVNASGEKTLVELQGFHPAFGKTFVLPNAPIKIASFSEILSKYRPHWNDTCKRFELFNRRTNQLDLIAPLEKDKTFPIHPNSNNQAIMICPVIEATIKSPSILLHQRLVHQNADAIQRALRLGHYGDVFKGQFDKEEVSSCLICSLAKDTKLKDEERGKPRNNGSVQVAKESKEQQVKPWSLPFGAIEVTVTMDVVFVVGALFLVAIVREIDLPVQIQVPSTKEEQLVTWSAFLLKKLNAASGIQKITYVNFDRESGIKERSFVNETGVSLRQSIPNVHNQNFETHIRGFRNQWRCMLLQVKGKIPLTDRIKTLAWEHVIKVQAFLMTPKTHPYLPIQLLLWPNDIYNVKKPFSTLGFPYRTPVNFGQFVIVKRRNELDKSACRRQVAIILGMEIETRAIIVRFADSHLLFQRHSFRALDDEQGLQLWVKEDNMVPFVGEAELDEEEEDLHLAQIPMKGLDVQQVQHENVIVNDDVDNEGEEDTLQVEHVPRVREQIELEENIAPKIQTPPTDVRKSIREKKSTRKEDFLYDEDDPNLIQARQTVKIMMLGVEEVGLQEPIHKMLERIEALIEDEQELEKKVHIQSKEGKDASIKLELLRVWKKYGAIKLVRLNASQKSKLTIIRSKLFSIEKDDKEGKFDKFKSRIVARGDLRHEDFDVAQTFSPTFAFQSFLVGLNLIVDLDMEWDQLDIENAYLHAGMNKAIFMILSAQMVQYMKEIDPSIVDYIQEDGTVIVQLIKALYGLQESAKLWYQEVSTKLVQMGFKASAKDQSIFYQRVEGQLNFLIIYVDDMLSKKTISLPLSLPIRGQAVKAERNGTMLSFTG
jgi:hypothetical protein